MSVRELIPRKKFGLEEAFARSQTEGLRALSEWVSVNQLVLRDALMGGSDHALILRADLSEVERELVAPISPKGEWERTGSISDLLEHPEPLPLGENPERLAEAIAVNSLHLGELGDQSDNIWAADELFARCVYDSPNDLAVRLWSEGLAKAPYESRDLWIRGFRERFLNWEDPQQWSATPADNALSHTEEVMRALKLEWGDLKMAVYASFNHNLGNSIQLSVSNRAVDLRERAPAEWAGAVGRALVKTHRHTITHIIAYAAGMRAPARSESPGMAGLIKQLNRVFSPDGESPKKKIKQAAIGIGCLRKVGE